MKTKPSNHFHRYNMLSSNYLAIHFVGLCVSMNSIISGMQESHSTAGWKSLVQAFLCPPFGISDLISLLTDASGRSSKRWYNGKRLASTLYGKGRVCYSNLRIIQLSPKKASRRDIQAVARCAARLRDLDQFGVLTHVRLIQESFIQKSFFNYNHPFACSFQCRAASSFRCREQWHKG